MKITILDAATLGADLDLSIFKELGELEIYPLTPAPQVKERIAHTDVIITNKVILNEENLKDAPKVKQICLTATGYNNIDIKYCQENDIALCNVAGYSTNSVAQHTFSLLFYLLQNSRYYDDLIRDESFLKTGRFLDVSKPWFEISGKTWGIIGLGAIGRKVAQIATAFGAKVIYASTSGVEREENYKRVDFNTLYKDADIISIHAPLNDKTKDLIGLKELRQIGHKSILLNLGRGPIINEEDLIKAIKEGMIGPVGLDVLTQEPPEKGNKLIALADGEHLYITPHQAWGSIEARTTLMDEVKQNIKAFSSGEKRNRVV